MDEPQEEQDQAVRDPGERLLIRLRIATEVLSMIYLAWVMWTLLIPEHKRRLALMKATAAIRQIAARAASRTGHQAMGLELSGSGANYELPYRLSQLRDLAARLYDKVRYTTS